MPPTIPTVVAFFGPPPDYLGVCLRSAAELNDRVVLLGDDENRGFWNDHWDSSGLELPKLESFEGVYTKMSDYSESFESAFWRRPFVIEEWMKREGVDRAFVLDSDIVIFADYSSDVLPALPTGCPAALMTYRDQPEYSWATSLHFSYWTAEALADFTSFCIEAYRDESIRSRLERKYQHQQEHDLPGGVCEMTLLYLWRQRQEGEVFNLAKAWSGMTDDLGVSTPDNHRKDEYEMRLGLKKLVFRDGFPFGHNRILGERVRFLCVHCQGHRKDLMSLLHDSPWRRMHGLVYSMQRFAARRKRTLKSLMRRALRPAGAG